MKIRLNVPTVTGSLIATGLMAALLPFTMPYFIAWSMCFSVNVVLLMIGEVASRAATGEWID